MTEARCARSVRVTARREILEDLGYADAEIAALVDRGVVAAGPDPLSTKSVESTRSIRPHHGPATEPVGAAEGSMPPR